MNTHIDPQRLHAFELWAAVNSLRPDAAPLAAALVRAGCLVVPEPDAMLALLDRVGGDHMATCSEAACTAMVTAYAAQQHGAALAPGAASPWQALADMGLTVQAQAAVVFALNIAHAALDRAANGDAGPLLH